MRTSPADIKFRIHNKMVVYFNTKSHLGLSYRQVLELDRNQDMDRSCILSIFLKKINVIYDN